MKIIGSSISRRNTRFVISFLMLFYSSSIYSQITITEIEKKINPIVEKPAPYDSLKDWQLQDKFIDYKQYVGLELFIPPMPNADNSIALFSKNLQISGNYTTYVYKHMYYSISENYVCSDPKEISNRYYTILDVFDDKKSQEIYNTMHKVMLEDHGVNFNTMKKLDLNWGLGGYNGMMLRDNVTGDTLFQFERNIYRIGFGILVPYFVKQKQLYNGKTLIYITEVEDNRADPSTEKQVLIKPNSKWVCEVTLLKDGNARHSHYSLSYVLKNELNETIALNELWNRGGSRNDMHFIAEEDYIKAQKEKKLKQAELIAKRKKEDTERINNEKKEKENHRIECINKFGQGNGELIAQGKVKIGMTSQMCKTAWNEPFYSNKTTVAEGVYEDWYYGWSKSLHFENGLLVRIEE
jgi:hypothetical protein